MSMKHENYRSYSLDQLYESLDTLDSTSFPEQRDLIERRIEELETNKKDNKSNQALSLSSTLMQGLRLLPFTLLLLYALYGATSGALVVPGRSDAVQLAGLSAWLMCLFPLCLLLGTYIEFNEKINIGQKTKKFIAFAFFVLGLFFAFYSVIRG